MPDPNDPVGDLTAAFAEKLRRTGQVIAPFDTDHERELYRRAGRAAGRLLDRPVKTLVQQRSVLIVLTDWTDNPLQVQVDNIRARNAIDEAFSAPDTQPSPPPAPSPRPLLKSVPPLSDDAD